MAEIVNTSENTDQSVKINDIPVEQEASRITFEQGDDTQQYETNSDRMSFGKPANASDTHSLNAGSGDDEEEEEEIEEENEEWSQYSEDEDEAPAPAPSRPRFTKVQELQRKATMLHQLKKLTESGRYSTIELTMNDPIEDIETELFRVKGEKQNEDSLDFAKKGFLLCIQGLEMASRKQNVIDIDLDGWGTAVSCDSQLGKYDEVLLELVEKYGASAAAGPEVKLVLMLVTSAFGVHVSNKMGASMQMKQQTKVKPPPPSINRPSVDISSVLKRQQASPVPDFEQEVPSVDELMARMHSRHQSDKRPLDDDPDEISSVASKRSRRSWAPSPPPTAVPSPSPPTPPPMISEEPRSVAMEDILAQPDDASVIAQQPAPPPKKKRAPRKPKAKPLPAEPEAEIVT